MFEKALVECVRLSSLLAAYAGARPPLKESERSIDIPDFVVVPGAVVEPGTVVVPGVEVAPAGLVVVGTEVTVAVTSPKTFKR